MFVDKYEGSVNGALLVGKWRVDLDKKEFIKINPAFSIFYINEEENRKYQRYLNRNTVFTYGSNLNKNMVLVVQELEEEIKGELSSGLSGVVGNVGGANQSSGAKNIQGQNSYVSGSGSGSYSSQVGSSSVGGVTQQVSQATLSIPTSTIYTSNTISSTLPLSTTAQVSTPSVSSIQSQSQPLQTTSSPSTPTSSSTTTWNTAQPSPSSTQSASSPTSFILSGNQAQTQTALPSSNNLRTDSPSEIYNTVNAQIRNSLLSGSKYLRTGQPTLPSTYQTQKSSTLTAQPVYQSSLPVSQGQNTLAGAFAYFRAFN